jgi:putative FmdB family regulatory protein
MPFYEYECPSCKHTTEVLQKITDKPLSTCPACGKRGLRRLVSAPVFRLKGSGWYETDFKTDKDSKRNLVGSDTESKSESKPEAKVEAKTEAKADTTSEAKSEAKPEKQVESKPAANKRKTTPVKRAAPASKRR